METGFFEHNNGKLYFEVVGEGEPIVLIHGFSLDHRMWEPQVEFLKDKFKVITYDLRGFGKSSVPTDKYSHHDDLKALLEHLGISNTHLVGLSLGGEIAIDFALAFPNMAKSLVLADSSLGGYKSTVDWNVHPEEGLERAKENWLNHEVLKKTRENINASKKLRGILADYSGWHWFNSDSRERLDPTALERLEEIKVPTLIIVGEKDLPYYHDISNILTSKINISKKFIFPEAGHMVNLENPEKFNQIVLDFLRN